MNNADIDKNSLYEDYNASRKWQDKLFRKGCHKALDIPDDDMQINNSGISGFNLVAIAAIALIAWLIFNLFDKQVRPDAHSPTPAVQQSPLEAQEYDVEFWFDEDTQIEVIEQ